MAQHALMCREKARLSQPALGESLRIAEGSSFWGHVSPAHDKAHVAPVHADVHTHDPYSAAGPNVFAPISFPGGPKYISLLPLHEHHATIHVWE